MKKRSDGARGFTLLEVMCTVAIIGVAIFPLLLIRERSIAQSQLARNANVARTLARQILSELEAVGLDTLSGQIDGFPGYEYEIQVDVIDLVSGEGEEDDEAAKQQEKTGYKPIDAMDPNEDEEDEYEYPLRRVTLTLSYPDIRADAKSEGKLKLVIETILPALPDDENSSDFGKVFGN